MYRQRIISLLLTAALLLPMAACCRTLPNEREDADDLMTTLQEFADTSVDAGIETTEADTEETTGADTDSAAQSSTPPDIALSVKKVHPDPAVTRLLSANVLRAEVNDEADQPCVLFDGTTAKYRKLQSTEIVKNYDVSYTWRFGSNASMEIPLSGERRDLSGYEAISFWVYVPEEYVGATFLLYFLSENPDTDGIDYYAHWVNLETAGWNNFAERLTSFTATRTPLGWDKIDRMVLTSSGWNQTNDPRTVLQLETITLHTNADAVQSSGLSLGDAVAFSLNGPRAVYDSTVVEISALDDSSVVFFEDDVYWLPLSVFAAYRDDTSEYNAASHVISFTLDGKRRVYTGGSDTVTVDGRAEKLDFTVRINGDSLFVPHTYAMDLFGYSELYTDSMGVVILSNGKIPYSVDENLTTLLRIAYATLFTRPSGESIAADLVDHLGGDVHPRIMLTGDDFDRLRGYSQSDETFQAWVAELVSRYGPDSSEFKDAPVEWELTDGVRLLAISREAKNRIIPWCMLYQLTGDTAYAERIWREVEALCKFRDWHPDHFLDTAEICYPMAIAYDWLYDYWTPERRQMMEEATLQMGILPGLDRYEGRASMWGDNNWTGVCNGGLVAAALAYLAAYPEECTALLGYAILDVEKGMYTYAPDGGYLESPGYWSYGTDYLHVMISALDSACGTDYGLYNSPGFAASAYFTAYFETEDGCWGFHDSGSGVSDTNCLSWFAKKSGDPSVNRLRRNSIDNGVKSVHIYDVMWYDPENLSDTVQLSLDAYYSEVGAVTMRDTWENDALFVGLHGGDNSASHGDLDIGNFFIDAAGQRFITELGSDNYNIPSYFGNLRWNYYRKRAEGQNTLVIGDVSCKKADQVTGAKAKFLRVENNDASSIAVVDMSTAYTAVREGQRGLMLTDDRSTVIVQDEIHLSSPEIVRWSAHTGGTVIINAGGRSAFIKKGNTYLYCEIVSDDPALTFSTGKAVSFDPSYPTTSGEYNRSNIRKLMIVTSEKVTDFEAAVVFRVVQADEIAPGLGATYTWTDIADWKLQE